MNEKMVRVNDDTRKKLKILAAKIGITMGELIEIAIDKLEKELYQNEKNNMQ